VIDVVKEIKSSRGDEVQYFNSLKKNLNSKTKGTATSKTKQNRKTSKKINPKEEQCIPQRNRTGNQS
jgi:hypothetical protein